MNANPFNPNPEAQAPPFNPYQAPPRMALRVMDLQTGAPVLADPLVERYEGGVWYGVEYDRGLKLRFMSIDGVNTVSAVVFDRA